jgi:hypothetical protein
MFAHILANGPASPGIQSARPDDDDMTAADVLTCVG